MKLHVVATSSMRRERESCEVVSLGCDNKRSWMDDAFWHDETEFARLRAILLSWGLFESNKFFMSAERVPRVMALMCLHGHVTLLSGRPLSSAACSSGTSLTSGQVRLQLWARFVEAFFNGTIKWFAAVSDLGFISCPNAHFRSDIWFSMSDVITPVLSLKEGAPCLF